MNVSAINCSPIKPQVSFGAPEGVDEANKVLTLSKELSDTFKKEDSEGNQIKNPLHTALSVLTAGMAMFALGKGIGKLGWKGLDKAKSAITPEKMQVVKDKVHVAKDFVSKQTAKLPKNEKVATFFNKTVGKAANAVKTSVAKAVEKNGAEKVFTTAAGVVAASTLVPKVATADANGDGIADIAQSKVNAYQSAFKSAEIFADMVNALA